MSTELIDFNNVLQKTGGFIKTGIDISNFISSTVNTVDIFGDSSCKALYRFEGNANDTSGNYNGVILGSGSILTYVDGKFGKGMYLQNSGTTRVQLNGISQLLQTTSLTLNIWVNYVSNGYEASFFNIATGSGTYTSGIYNQMHIGFINSSVYFNIKRGDWLNTNEVKSSTQTNILGAGWKMCTITLDKISGNINAYIDSVLVWSLPSFLVGGFTNTGVADSECYIGNHTANTWWNNIQYDQARIFNKALSQEEVTKLYNEYTPTYIPTKG